MPPARPALIGRDVARAYGGDFDGVRAYLRIEGSGGREVSGDTPIGQTQLLVGSCSSVSMSSG
jgi:hypothetical protein